MIAFNDQDLKSILEIYFEQATTFTVSQALHSGFIRVESEASKDRLIYAV